MYYVVINNSLCIYITYYANSYIYSQMLLSQPETLSHTLRPSELPGKSYSDHTILSHT